MNTAEPLSAVVHGDGESFGLPHLQMTAQPADLAQKQAWAEEWVKKYL